MEERPLTFGPIATPVCLGCHNTLPPKKVFKNIKNQLCLSPGSLLPLRLANVQ